MNNIVERLRSGFGGIVPTVCDEAANKIEKLEKDLELEMMRLTACGQAALSNTPESMASLHRDIKSEYTSASFYDVCAAVGREMKYRINVGGIDDYFILLKDGKLWCAVRNGFVNLQESNFGFADSADVAISILLDVEKES